MPRAIANVIIAVHHTAGIQVANYVTFSNWILRGLHDLPSVQLEKCKTVTSGIEPVTGNP